MTALKSLLFFFFRPLSPLPQKSFLNLQNPHFKTQRSYPLLKKKIKDFSRTFKDPLHIFQALYSVQKGFHNMSNFFLKVCEPWKLNPSKEPFRSKLMNFWKKEKKDIKTEHEQKALWPTLFPLAIEISLGKPHARLCWHIHVKKRIQIDCFGFLPHINHLKPSFDASVDEWTAVTPRRRESLGTRFKRASLIPSFCRLKINTSLQTFFLIFSLSPFS